MSNAKQTIETGKAVLGIEFGSTRIKAVLVNETGDRKSTRLNSSHSRKSRMPSSA